MACQSLLAQCNVTRSTDAGSKPKLTEFPKAFRSEHQAAPECARRLAGTSGCCRLLATSIATPFEESQMKAILFSAAFAVAVVGLALTSTPAPAKGCLKGAVVGGVAGHFAGHHGL